MVTLTIEIRLNNLSNFNDRRIAGLSFLPMNHWSSSWTSFLPLLSGASVCISIKIYMSWSHRKKCCEHSTQATIFWWLYVWATIFLVALCLITKWSHEFLILVAHVWLGPYYISFNLMFLKTHQGSTLTLFFPALKSLMISFHSRILTRIQNHRKFRLIQDS